MLKVEGLNAGYGSVNILWDIGFEVKDGEIVAILGSNGAGKTTMVRTITGMVKASSGKVEFNGEDLSGKSSRVILDSGIVQVPEGRQLFTEMTVLENLELGAFNKETKAHFAENLEKCYNWFPKLRERAKQAAGTLSGGEQQMVAVARALIGMPKLLILDEPSLGLAPNIVDDILEVAKTMVKNDGISVLLVEQDITKALAAADRGYVIENGRVALEGTAAELSANEHVKKAVPRHLIRKPDLRQVLVHAAQPETRINKLFLQTELEDNYEKDLSQKLPEGIRCSGQRSCSDRMRRFFRFHQHCSIYQHRSIRQHCSSQR